MFSRLRYDINAIKARDPAARSSLEVLLLYPGLSAVRRHRRAHWLWRHGCKFLARLYSQWSRFWTNIEIHPGAVIGKGLFIDHGAGVVIGETAVIGDDVHILSGVVLGGNGKDTGKRHPTVGDRVFIGAGACILGPFRIGDGAKIAAGAVVLAEVPDEATAVGVPARIVRIAGRKVGAVDQLQTPDPLAQELCALRIRLDKLEKMMQNTEESP